MRETEIWEDELYDDDDQFQSSLEESTGSNKDELKRMEIIEIGLDEEVNNDHEESSERV